MRPATRAVVPYPEYHDHFDKDDPWIEQQRRERGVDQLELTTGVTQRFPNKVHNSASAKYKHSPPYVYQKQIENVVFQHKLILIGNKNLPDTVVPTQHWSMKQSKNKSGGCSCCAPEDDDEEEENKLEASTTESKATTSKSSLLSLSNRSAGGMKNRGYVDGKAMFAFDPTKFA